MLHLPHFFTESVVRGTNGYRLVLQPAVLTSTPESSIHYTFQQELSDITYYTNNAVHNLHHGYVCDRSSTIAKYMQGREVTISVMKHRDESIQRSYTRRGVLTRLAQWDERSFWAQEIRDRTTAAHGLDRERFPSFAFVPAVFTLTGWPFFLRMPLRLSEGYSHLMERRWHWLIDDESQSFRMQNRLSSMGMPLILT